MQLIYTKSPNHATTIALDPPSTTKEWYESEWVLVCPSPQRTLLTRALFFRFRWRRKRAAAKVIPFPMDLPDMFLEGQIETSESIILVVVDRDGLRMVDRATGTSQR